MADPHVHYEVDGRIGRLTLDRPRHGNLITTAMMETLRDTLRSARATVDVIVVGSRGPDFTLGRDRADRPAGMTPDDSLRLAIEVNQALDSFGGIIVAVVRGRALGFGSGLVVKSDIAIAGDGAVLGFDEIRHGFPPMIVMSYLGDHLLRRHVLELILTGRELAAAEGVAIGMVNRVVPDGALDAEVEALLTGLTALDAVAFKRAKRYLREIEAVAPDERAGYALREQSAWFDTAAKRS